MIITVNCCMYYILFQAVYFDTVPNWRIEETLRAVSTQIALGQLPSDMSAEDIISVVQNNSNGNGDNIHPLDEWSTNRFKHRMII